ncbi:peptidase S8 [Chlorobaculum thiosulfatiphilum]|uniref:Peptidase S8 n=2 Tax=Chlorobaculum thiosulfatiphilum TaxID=115852 RepID=A0A5C4S965_CHLTI|nr:peptidase S8 [Chlorobaculum thiosulfatiphilum]
MSNKNLLNGTLGVQASAMNRGVASTAIFTDAGVRQNERESTHRDWGDTVSFKHIMELPNHQADGFQSSLAWGDFNGSNHFVGAWPDYPGQSPVDDSPDSGEMTAAARSLNSIHIRDKTAPTVVSFDPADGSGDVDPEASITLTFSEAIQAGSGSIDIHAGSPTGAVLESFDVASSSHLAFSGSTLTIDPSSALAGETHYYVTIGSDAVHDLAGNSYLGADAYDFTTESTIESITLESVLWDPVSGHGLLDIDAMLEAATGQSIADAPLYGDGYGSWDWGLNDIQAPDAWQAGYTGEGIVVAVIDTGVLYTHSDLDGNIWINTGEISGNGVDDDGNGYVDDIYGYDFVNYDGYALDDNGHGTHIAGIIAGEYNGTGVTGVAYDATIMPVKVLSSSGGGTFTAVANGIMYAVNNGADVINLSMGAYGSYSSSLTNAISYALDHGVIVCMASGNNSQTSPTYPAVLAKTLGGIAVGAVNSSNVVASWSNDAGNTDPYDFVVAPGVSIYSTYKNGGYVSMSGTSMAAPFAAGAAALLLSAEEDYASDWSLEQLENILTHSAEFLGAIALSSSTSVESSLGAASAAGFDAASAAEFLSAVDADPVALTGVLDGVPDGYEVFAV